MRAEVSNRSFLSRLAALGAACALCLSAGTVPAAEQAEPLAEDPQLEARVMDLSHKLRCLVCQNQTIAESNAPLALDLRNQVREQLAAGKSEEAVVDYLVARYGDFVLYLPPFKGITLLLWVGPGLLLVAGAGWFAWRLRARAKEAEGAPHLSQDERARASALLEGKYTSSEEPRT